MATLGTCYGYVGSPRPAPEASISENVLVEDLPHSVTRDIVNVRTPEHVCFVLLFMLLVAGGDPSYAVLFGVITWVMVLSLQELHPWVESFCKVRSSG